MTTVSGILKPDPDFPAPGNKQTDAENQREAWLRQMEMSQIALLQQTGSAATPASTAGLTNKGFGPTVALLTQQSNPQMPRGQGNGPASFLPVHPILGHQQSPAQRVQGTGAAEPLAPPAAPAAPARADSAAPVPAKAKMNTAGSSEETVGTALPNEVGVRVPANEAGNIGATVAKPAAPGAASFTGSIASHFTGFHGAPVRQPANSGNLSTSASAPVNASADASGKSLPAQSIVVNTPSQALLQWSKDNRPQDQDGTAVVAATNAFADSVAAPPLLGSAANLPPEIQMPQATVQGAPALAPSSVSLPRPVLDSSAADEGSESAEPETAPPKRSDIESVDSGEDWQKRLMHVSQNGQDVSLSIRDTSLQPAQSAQIVYRMAADVAQSGLRLRNATVNGKQILKQTGGDSSIEVDAPADDAAEALDAPERAHFTTSQDNKER